MVQISIPTAAAIAVVALAAAPAIAAPIAGGEQVETRAVRRPSTATVKRVGHGASRALDKAGQLADIVNTVQGLRQRDEIEARAIRRPSAASARRVGHGASRALDHAGNIVGIVSAVQSLRQRDEIEARAIRRPSSASVRRALGHGASRALDHAGNIVGIVGAIQSLRQRDLSDEGLEARGGVPPGIGRAVKNVFRHVVGRFRNGPRDLEDVEARDVDEELEMRDFEDLEDLFEREYEIDEMD